MENEMVAPPNASNALQGLCIGQPAILVGFMSIMTSHVLQDDLLSAARKGER
jgi:hypothetical protein